MSNARSRLYRRERSPFWYACWTDYVGAVHRESTRCTSHKAAMTWLAMREMERLRGEARVREVPRVTLKVAWEEYADQRQWSDGWRVAVKGFFTNSVLPHLGADKVVATVTRADVERFRSREVSRPRRVSRCCRAAWMHVGKRGWLCSKCQAPAPADVPIVSHATVNRLMAALAAFGEWCLVEGRNYHQTNAWTGHEALPEDSVPIPEVEEETIQRLFDVLENPPPNKRGQPRKWRAPWRLILEFARETGLRRSELSRIAWPDVSVRTGILQLVSTRARGHTKGRKGRPVILSPRALEILREVGLEDETKRLRADGRIWGRIPDPRRAMATAAALVGLDRLWLHLFRHLFASRLAERGAGRQELRDAGGWSSSRMPDRYTHSRMSRLRTLIDRPSTSKDSDKK